MPSRRLCVFTWHVHGNYLWYLSQAECDFYVPFKSGGLPGYGGRGASFPFGSNVHELPAERVREHEFDCILYQTRRNYFVDQYEILTAAQRQLPRIYLEHDPPQVHPTDQRHWVDDPDVLLVHVTHFNAQMWDSGRTPTKVIEHGVRDHPHVRYSGELGRGIVVINNLSTRGRRLGGDIFEQAREIVPLDLVGMAAKEMGGLGAIDPPMLAEFESHYRFFFNPIRHTSLGLAVCEAMMIGMPIVGLATTELSTVIENGKTGFIDTDLSRLVAHMREFLRDPHFARACGAAARRYALERFDIRRFAEDWERTFAAVTADRRPLAPRGMRAMQFMPAHVASQPAAGDPRGGA